MAFDPEEFKRRREEREQQRQQRKAQQKKLYIKLGIAGLAVILCTVLILSLTRSDPKPAAPTPAPEASASPTEPPAQTVIRLTAAGDLNVTRKVVASGGVNYDYTDTFLDVAHLLADANITVVNLEGTVTGEPYGEDRSAPPQLLEAMTAAGVDFVQLANSYTVYKGMEGLKQTHSAIYVAGMEPLGAYPSPTEASDAGGYTIRWCNGVKVALVAFTKGMDGMALPSGNEGCVNLLYTDYATEYQQVDTEGITKVLDAVEKEKPDVTVALLHWGSEFNNTVSESQKTIVTLMQDKGVDAIIGTHSHYVQEVKYDPDAGTVVAYSLGDFIGDADRAGSEYSIILELEITKDNTTGTTRITDCSYTPVFTLVQEDAPVRVLRIREAMKAYEDGYLDRVGQPVYEAMAYALQRIEARVKGE